MVIDHAMGVVSMPYIKHEKRVELLDLYVYELFEYVDCAGDLNYIVSDLCNAYLQRHGLNYKNLNELIGALECAKIELYRRMAAPYEDQKILENGDVYDIS